MRPTTVDAIVIEQNKLLLVKRGIEPFINCWALPGGFVEDNETVEQAVVREAKEETGVDVKPIKLLGVYSSPKRDVRKTIAVAFLCEKLGGETKGNDDASEAGWFPIENLPKLAFDHDEIVRDALFRSKKLRYK
ncbi:NUDIX hydrolase [Candidatus Micrarchaeota archaeon]|nr:NUDIX hydrolase [Candidatus Micrarchaeota archaeon]